MPSGSGSESGSGSASAAASSGYADTYEREYTASSAPSDEATVVSKSRARTNAFIEAMLVKTVAAVARNDPKVDSVTFVRAHLGSRALIRLSSALRRNTHVKTLILSDNAIGDRGCRALARALVVNSTLATVDLSANVIGDLGAERLATALRSNTTVRSLNLWGNRICMAGLVPLARAARRSRSLLALDVGRNWFSLSDGQRAKLLRGVSVTPTTRTLFIRSRSASSDDLSDPDDADVRQGAARARESASVLGKCAREAVRLRSLGLSRLRLDAAAVRTLAGALAASRTVDEVNLSNNQVGDRGARALAAAIARGSPMRKLSVRSNGLSDKGRKALFEAANMSYHAIELLF